MTVASIKYQSLPGLPQDCWSKMEANSGVNEVNEDEVGSVEGLFTKQMRDKTREIHTLSDHLVNLKLGIAMSKNEVWVEGISLFYPIFRYLEMALERHQDSLLGDFLSIKDVFNRTKAFEKDLEHFNGQNWRDTFEDEVLRRPQVSKYLHHLSVIEDENPYLLMAYIYHLYMGLLSGGQVLILLKSWSLKIFKTPHFAQILQGKRRLFKLKKSDEVRDGEALTHFGESIPSLKRKIKTTTNAVSEEIDEETKQMILSEGVRVFELNNELVKTVKGVDDIFRATLIKALAVIVVLVAFILGVWWW